MRCTGIAALRYREQEKVALSGHVPSVPQSVVPAASYRVLNLPLFSLCACAVVPHDNEFDYWTSDLRSIVATPPSIIGA